MKRALFALTLAFLSVMSLSTSAASQGMVGSVTVRGNVDSVFRGFVAFVRERGYPIHAQDSVKREVRFLTPDTNGEAVDVRMGPLGDSTEVVALGARGTMRPVVMGLGTFQAYLSRRDSLSTRHPPSERARPNGGW